MGFDVSDGRFAVGRVVHECSTEPSWTFGDAFERDDAAVHPNLIDRVDHVVYAVPELDPAIAELTDMLGIGPRRRAFPRGPNGPEMAFFTLGEGFIEVVASGQPAALWGIAFSTPDLDACVAAVRAAGGPIGDPKPAVQGGRIASVGKEHVGWGIAVMEPPASKS